MATQQKTELLHHEDLHPVGNTFMGIDRRMHKRALEVRDQTGRWLAENPEQQLPDVHSIVYARQHRPRHVDIAPPTPLETLKGVHAAVQDIQNQDYLGGRKGQIIAVVNAEAGHKEKYEAYARQQDIRLLTVQPAVPHPVAYNQALLELSDEQGLVWMTESGARLATKQAFHAGALAIKGDVAAIQGTALAGRNAGTLEASFYNAASMHPQFIGHKPRQASPGMGFFAVNRSLVSLDALAEVSHDFDSGPGPFNPEYGNGGYDGELGSRLGDVQMDWAASVILSEGLSASQMTGLVRREWPSYSQPNTYLPPVR